MFEREAGDVKGVTSVVKKPAAEPVACNFNNDVWSGSRNHCWPVRGGITVIQGETGAACTQTLNGRRDSNGERVIVGAAHCDGGLGDADTNWFIGQQPFVCYSDGTTSGYYWYPSGDGSARFCPRGASPTSNQNDIYQAVGNNWPVDNTPDGESGTEGQSLRCVSGVGYDAQHYSPPQDETGSECGVLWTYAKNFRDFGWYVDGAQCDCNGILDQQSVDGLVGGDSGAPISAMSTTPTISTALV